jgi:hypothetical protein
MAKRVRRWVWWGGIGAVSATAAYAGTWRMWALTVLLWSMYELCFCPTRCGVTAREGRPCRNEAQGRLYACTAVPAHQQIKTDALWRLTGSRFTHLRATNGQEVPAAHRKVPLAPAEHGSIEPGERFMAYLAVLTVLGTIVQTAVGLATL